MPQSKSCAETEEYLPQAGDLVLFGGGLKKANAAKHQPTDSKGCTVTANTSTNRVEVYRMCSQNTRERSQRFALGVADCDLFEITLDCL